MKKISLILLPFFALLIFVLPGCDKTTQEPVCDYHVRAYVTSVTGTTTALVNQEIDVNVFFGVVNGCGLFESFTETTTGNSTTINVSARYNGCYCTQTPQTRNTVYKFKRTAAGTYNLLFYLSETSFLTYAITVT